MSASSAQPPARAYGPPRRLILGAALALALAAWLAPKIPAAVAQETKASVAAVQETKTPAESPAAAAPKPAPSGETGTAVIRAETAPASEPAATDPKRPRVKDEKDPVTGQRTITVTKDGKTVTVTGIPSDQEFDSFDELLHTEPALAVMIVAIVAVIFLSPVFAIALILTYRMRKARMQNETMLKLAEKGVVPPAEAMGAVMAGTVPSLMSSLDASAPAAGAAAPIQALPPVEHINVLHRRTAWSDLRKGIVIGAIGLGITLYYVIHGRAPNVVALVLLFVGIGYVVLWFFEDRQLRSREGGPGNPPGAGSGNVP